MTKRIIMPPKATVYPSSRQAARKAEREKQKAKEIIMPPKATKEIVMPPKASVIQIKKTTPALPGVKQTTADVKKFASGVKAEEKKKDLTKVEATFKPAPKKNYVQKTRNPLQMPGEANKGLNSKVVAGLKKSEPNKKGKGSLSYLGEQVVGHLDNSTDATPNMIDAATSTVIHFETKLLNWITDKIKGAGGSVPKWLNSAIENDKKLAEESDARISERNKINAAELEKVEQEYSHLPESKKAPARFVGQAVEMTPNVLLSVVNPVYGTAYIGATAYTNGYAEAIKDGADKDEAISYGTASALLEIALEKLGGNKLFGGKTLTDNIMDKAVKRIAKNKTVQRALKFALETNEEGIEEVLNTMIQPFLKGVIYKGEYDAPTIDNLTESYFGGIIGSAVWSGTGKAVDTVGNLFSKNTNKDNVIMPPKSEGNNEVILPPGAKDVKIVEGINQSPEMIKSINAIYQRTGLIVSFGRKYNPDGRVDNGFRGYIKGNRIVVSETATDSEIFNAIVLHELTHSIEGTKQYAEIEKYVIEKKYNGDTEAYANDVRNKIAEYKRHNENLTETDAKSEIVAASVEEYIFADDVKSIVEQDYTFAQKVYDYIGELIYSLKSKYGNTLDIDRLKHAQRQYRMALESVKKINSKSQGHYSIETIPGTNKKYVKFDSGLQLGENRNEWPSKIENHIKKEIIKNGDFNVVTEDGDNIVINGRTAWKIADVEKTENGVKVPMTDSELRVKYEAGSHIDELVGISKRGKENKPDDGSHDWADEWNYRTAFFEDSNGDYYRVKISVGINQSEAASYNVGDIQKRGKPRNGSSSANGDGGALNGVTSQEIVYHDSDPNVKTAFEVAFEKANEKKNGQFSFATTEDTETGKFTDVDGNEYKSVVPEVEEFGVRILSGKDGDGADSLKIDIDNPDVLNITETPEYKSIIENAFAIKEVKGTTLTAERAFEKAFGESYSDFQKVVYGNLDRSKLQYLNILDYLKQGLEENVIKRGIKKGSKDSELLQKYGEGVINEFELRELTDNWQNIVEAERYMRKMYDTLLDSVNATKQKIYPYVEEQETALREELDDINNKLDLIEQGKLTTAVPMNVSNKILRAQYIENALKAIKENSATSIDAVNKKIEKVKAEMDSKVRKDTKVYAQLSNQLANLEAKKERLKEFYKQSEAKKREQLEKLLEEYADSQEMAMGISRKTVEDLKAKRDSVEKELYDELRWRGKRVPKRKDYFRHFQEYSNSILGELLNGRKGNIAAEMVLISEGTKPLSKWSSFAQRRKGEKTVYDAVGGYLDYIDAAAYAMTIDPNISIIRQLTKDLTYETSSTTKGKHGENNANATIMRLDALANELAGKTVTQTDRNVQDNIGRKNFKIAKMVINRIKTSQILYNLGSAVVQISNLPNAMYYMKNKATIIPALSDSWKELYNGNISMYDAILNKTPEQAKSSFLRERYYDGKSKFNTGILAKAERVGEWMLSIGDEVSTRLVWNAFYREAKRVGAENPIQYADSKTRKSVGGRGLGEKSMAQQSAVVGAAFPYTLEVSNTWQVHKDFGRALIKGIKDKDIKEVGNQIGSILAMWVSVAIISEGLKKIRGSDGGMFNPVGIILKNLWPELFGEEDKEEDNKFLKILQELGGNFVSSLPVGQKVTEYYPEYGIPIGDKQYLSRAQLFGDEDPTRYGTSSIITSAIKSPLTSFYPGGSQVKKSVEAGKILAEGGVYDKDGNLKYPVEKNAKNVIKGIAFGKSAFAETDDYYNNDRRALTEKETGEYHWRVERGEDPQAVYNDIIGRKDANSQTSEENAKYKEEAGKNITGLDDDLIYGPEEIYRAYKKIDSSATTIGVPQASKTFSYDGKKYDLTAEQYAQLQNMYNQEYANEVRDVVSSDMSVEDKYSQIYEKRKIISDQVKDKFASEVLGVYVHKTYKDSTYYKNHIEDDELENNAYYQKYIKPKQQTKKGLENNKYYQKYLSEQNRTTAPNTPDLENNAYYQKYIAPKYGDNVSFKNYEVTNYNDSSHKGMDFATPIGTKVQSTVAGTVVVAETLKDSYGKYVVIKDANGNYHYFAHLDGYNVKVGDTVGKGTLIGYSGNTGNSTGPHLHYEVRQGNDYAAQINPKIYL